MKWTNHKVKVKEGKKLDKNVDLVRELKNDMEPKSDTSDNWSPQNNPQESRKKTMNWRKTRIIINIIIIDNKMFTFLMMFFDLPMGIHFSCKLIYIYIYIYNHLLWII